MFPEEHQNSSRLTYYATFFNSIEINSTFYKLPLQKTIDRWASSVPEDFKFTFKLWQEITHKKGLEFQESDVELFFNAISPAGHKKACVLIQFPPSLSSAYIQQLNELLRCVAQVNTNHEWKIAVEFRNRSWYQPQTYDLLESYNAAIVIQDIPKSITPQIDHLSDFIYVRFHGPTGNYKDSYAEHFLEEYSTYLQEWLMEGKIVYTYFNNTAGDAFNNLESLNKFIMR
ncbi:MAG TPA: DUF72 domain-containing protein [Bacteroidia bacterium]|jgi:uncharacterized protein YecE (DUF72 family)|nr:DUF72 domain-containing protein [Bacteroidia bacterium]